jgi:hypothetical protein
VTQILSDGTLAKSKDIASQSMKRDLPYRIAPVVADDYSSPACWR